MRKLPILLVLLVLLLASLLLLAAAASAYAFSLPAPAAAPSLAVGADDEGEVADDEDEADAGEEEADPAEEADDEGEACEAEDAEEEELCEEIEAEEEAEECVLEDAEASFTAAPGAGQVRLHVHYRAFEPTQVLVDARLWGSKGTLHLGSDRARFHRAGVFRYSFDLGGRQMAKAVAAKDFEVDLHAVGTPADCALNLVTRGPRRAR